MADYLGDVTDQVPGIPEGWHAWAWTDEIVFNINSAPGRYPIAQYPDVEGFFVVDWASHSAQQDTSVPTIGPFTTLTAAVAAWKLTQ
jgi:hypothetical protein